MSPEYTDQEMISDLIDAFDFEIVSERVVAQSRMIRVEWELDNPVSMRMPTEQDYREMSPYELFDRFCMSHVGSGEEIKG